MYNHKQIYFRLAKCYIGKLISRSDGGEEKESLSHFLSSLLAYGLNYSIDPLHSDVKVV